MRLRRSLLVSVAILVLFALATTVACWRSSIAKESPVAMTLVDTARLLGSPDPMQLEAEVAFPKLHFQRPLEFTYADDGSDRVFVVEQHGVIHVFENRDDIEKSQVFLDIHEAVSRDGNEEGLLGLAFHPRYKENGQFFVYYSVRNPRASVVARFRVSKEDPTRAVRESEEELLRIAQPYSNHNGGSMKFGPDGYLYIGMGDGGSGGDPHGNGQNLGTLLGKMLRIDVDHQDPGLAYAIPKDNPFVGREGARGEIWAYGLRNVWRLSFDRKTGDLWVGDVGQDRYEEVDRIVRGGNYGWKLREGLHPFDPQAAQTGSELIDPLVEYFRNEGMSVTGGVVYRGARLPEFEGAYFYGDYVTGNVWSLRYDGQRVTDNRKVARTALPITAFGEDRQGEMYFTAFDGQIHRFRRRDADLEAIRAAFPKKLSETGLFASTAELKPAAGLIPYDVNVPLWSDGARKARWMALPQKASVGFSATGQWTFPVGTVLVKTFFLDTSATGQPQEKRLETRLFVHAPEGWQGYTYVWNDAQTDAELLDGSATREYPVKTSEGTTQQKWYFPSRSDCTACHTKAAGFVLGLNTRQLNRRHDEGGTQANQLDRLSRMGVFSEPLAQSADRLEAYPDWDRRDSAPLETVVRAYLDANCAMCHMPGSVGNSRMDLRFHTPLDQAALLARQPGQGRLGPSQSRLVQPGKPEESEILYRISSRKPGQMPPLASSRVDPEAVTLLHRWIESLPPK